MQALGRIEDQVAGRQLDRLGAVHLFDDQFAAVIVLGLGQEEGGGQVAADAEVSPLADGVVDVDAELAAALVAIEQGRKDRVRQGGRDEHGVGVQGLDDQGRDLLRRRAVLGQLLVLLGRRGLVARGHVAVGPGTGVQGPAQGGDLGLGEDVGDVQQHGSLDQMRIGPAAQLNDGADMMARNAVS
ncbi:hypothetical protein D3C72_1186490 [compost metagenome]